MNRLPDYFLVDLPPEAALTQGMIAEACQNLRHNRERYLATRSTDSILHALVGLAQQWLDPSDRFRQLALAGCPDQTGFAPEILARGLDQFFSQFTEENLRALLVQEVGHEYRLDHLAASTVEARQDRSAMAHGPDLLAHIASGNLPCPVWQSMLLGLLVRSSQFVKCASGSAFLPRLLAHSLYELEPKVGACLEIAQWKGGQAALDSVLFGQADCITATGSDETLVLIKQQVPAKTRFVGYGHRVSFGFISARALTHPEGKRIAPDTARDIAAWNQLGCLSPHVIYVEDGHPHMAERFAEQLAAALEAHENMEPRGPIPVEVSAAIANRRAFYEIRAAHSAATKTWFSPGGTAWSVVYEEDPRFQASCLHRFIYVKAVPHLTGALQAADPIRTQVSTVGIAVTHAERPEVTLQLARWGAPRICRLGCMQDPPLGWRHDGRPAFADLLTWTDLEL